MSDGMTVILADGDFPAAPRALACLDRAERVVCCDGAARSLIRHGREPDWIVGDLDSLPRELGLRCADRLVRVAEQETNDLSKAFRFCLGRGFDRLTILGATGKREDHTLGNLALLADFARECPEIRLETDFGIFRAALHSGVFPSHPGEQISIFALDSSTVVTSENLKYPMNRLRLRSWWQATLNEALGESFRLDFSPGPLLLYRAGGDVEP